MATRNALRPFTQPVSAMRKNNLQALCRHFELDDDGPVTTLRRLLKTYLQNNRQQLEGNPVYTRLYPRHGRGRRPLADRDHDNENRDDNLGPQRDDRVSPTPSFNDEWDGIRLPDANVNNATDTAINTPPSSPPPDDPPRLPQLEITHERHRSASFSTFNFLFFRSTLLLPPSPLRPTYHIPQIVLIHHRPPYTDALLDLLEAS